MKSNDSTIENFLRDFLDLMIARAKQAKSSWKAAKLAGNERQELFEDARFMAYYEVLSSLINEAETFGLSKEQIPGLTFDADKELL